MRQVTIQTHRMLRSRFERSVLESAPAVLALKRLLAPDVKSNQRVG
jgi:hypothetical protein